LGFIGKGTPPPFPSGQFFCPTNLVLGQIRAYYGFWRKKKKADASRASLPSCFT